MQGKAGNQNYVLDSEICKKKKNKANVRILFTVSKLLNVFENLFKTVLENYQVSVMF